MSLSSSCTLHGPGTSAAEQIKAVSVGFQVVSGAFEVPSYMV